MKRNIIYTAACLVAFASCQKQEVAEAPSQVEVAVELTASAAADETKTVMTEYNAHWWSVSDKISLFYTVEGKTGHSVFTSKNLIPAASARFAGSLSLPAEDTDLTTVSALAVYPATTADASDGTSVNVTVPSVQTAVEGSFMEGAYPVVAKTSDLTAALSFKAVCGGVKVSFQTPGIKSFTFDAKGAKIAGIASVTFDTAGNPVAKPDESAVSVITVKAPAGGFEVGKWYYMTAFPATLTSGYTVTLSNGKSFGGTSSIAIKRSVFGVLDSKDAPDTYADIKANWKSIAEWESEKDYITDLQPAEGTGDSGELTLSQRTKFKRGLNTLKISSDASYIYGYVEINTSEYASSADALKNLALWIDADETHVGQGGGWYFSARKGFEKAVFGSISGDWNPDLYDQTKVGTALGTKITTKSKPGYGAGQYDGSVLKYSFVLDRRVIGIRNMSNIVLGISFFGTSWGNDYLINPDRGGYVLPLNNSLADIEDNPNRILKSLKSMSYWDSIDAAAKSGAQYDKGNTIVKFDSDARFIYGYFEANSDNMFYGSMLFCPSILKKLAVCIDTDGVTSGQGPNGGGNVSFGYGGYDVVLNGATASTTITDYKGWKAVGWAEGAEGGSKDNMPEYNVSPVQWNPKAYDMSQGIEDSWGKTVLAGTENKSGLGVGKGTWDSTSKTFKYTFAIDRVKLNLLECTDLNIGIAFYRQDHNGLACLPSYNGFTIKLNN